MYEINEKIYWKNNKNKWIFYFIEKNEQKNVKKIKNLNYLKLNVNKFLK